MANTLVFSDSLAHWTPSSGMAQKYTLGSGSGPALGSPSPSGGSYLTTGFVEAGFFSGTGSPATISACTIGCRLRIPNVAGIPSPGGYVFWALDSGTSGVSFNCAAFVDAAGDIGLGIQTGTAPWGVYSGGKISSNVWYYVEISISSFGASATVVIRLNSTQIVSGTTATNGGSTSTCGGFLVQSAAFGNASTGQICDIYVDSTANAWRATNANGTFVGCLFPAGAGTSTQWTNNGGASNHASAATNPPNPGTDFVSSSTDTQLDQYTLGSLPGAVTGVSDVNVLMYDGTSSGAGGVAAVIGNGSTTSIGSTWVTGATAQYILRPMSTNPLTSAPWALADFSTLQSGPKKIS